MSDSGLFDLRERTAVVTGGSGVLGRAMAKGLVDAGAQVCIIGRDQNKAEQVAREFASAHDRVLALSADVTQRAALERAAEQILARWERIDILVNAAGGNRPDATVTANQTFFDLPREALGAAVDSNLLGTILPCQVLGKALADARAGSIINISSMSASRPLTRVVAYAASKAAVENFTRWLAVYMAREVSPQIRVNAIAPGFFLGEQNRAMLVDATTGELTPRGRAIIEHTPAGRFGEPTDLVGTLLWLASPASAFVTGIVVPVDGGFSAFSGV
ncbi:MAG TPA: SDR family oxidoreductase [Anaerolineae bacterium]|nr:SDR family oxidoreductase [Anaerolineae bacterium]